MTARFTMDQPFFRAWLPIGLRVEGGSTLRRASYSHDQRQSRSRAWLRVALVRRGHQSDSRLSDDNATLHDHPDTPERTDIPAGIAVERSEVGEQAGLDAPHLSVEMQHTSGY